MLSVFDDISGGCTLLLEYRKWPSVIPERIMRDLRWSPHEQSVVKFCNCITGRVPHHWNH